MGSSCATLSHNNVGNDIFKGKGSKSAPARCAEESSVAGLQEEKGNDKIK